MSDHASGPRAVADPVLDITDMYAFPSPQRTGALVLVLNVFPFAGISALFSDAIDYRIRLRPVAIPDAGAGSSFAVGEKEHAISCRFAAPVQSNGGLVQDATCEISNGQTLAFRVNDERGAQGQGVRVFAGVRLDPFFFDGGKALQTIATRKLAFEAKGSATVFRQNVLSIVVEVDAARVFSHNDGPVFAVVGETLTTGPLQIRLERFGRAEVKNFLLLPKDFDTINRDIELRDLYNEEDAFRLGPAYGGAYRARFNANLAFWDSLDGKIDWTPDASGTHPLTEFLLADFMVVDISKPFSEESYLEIERAVLKSVPHRTCGGRWLNDDAIDTFLTLMVTGGEAPRISDGVDQATVPASQTFPYLAAPEPHPPAPKARALEAK